MTELSVTELKARAYDLIALKEQAQAELNAVNQRIGELFRQQEAKQRRPGQPPVTGVMPCAEDAEQDGTPLDPIVEWVDDSDEVVAGGISDVHPGRNLLYDGPETA